MSTPMIPATLEGIAIASKAASIPMSVIFNSLPWPNACAAELIPPDTPSDAAEPTTPLSGLNIVNLRMPSGVLFLAAWTTPFVCANLPPGTNLPNVLTTTPALISSAPTSTPAAISIRKTSFAVGSLPVVFLNSSIACTALLRARAINIAALGTAPPAVSIIE